VDGGVHCGQIPGMDDADHPAGASPWRFSAMAPDQCLTMIDVRAGVDEIDRLLVALIARRQGYMNAAARIKPHRGAVRDEARIEQVLANVRREAEAAGLSWAIAEPVWRTLIEQCIAHEFVVYDHLKPEEKPPGGGV
jgi:isochorismate pyruvate lyase